MRKSRKPIAVTLAVIVLVLAVAVFLRLFSKRAPQPAPQPNQTAAPPIIAPPAPGPDAKSASQIHRRGAATREAMRRLNALCDTGASDRAVSEMRGFAGRLDDDAQPFAHDLSALLKFVLSYLDAPSLDSGQSDNDSRHTASLPEFHNIPRDLLDRAAAACDARGGRKPGEIVLSFAGDCTFGSVNGDGGAGRFPAMYRRSRRPDYPFALVRPWFLNDDLSVVNFECTLTDAVQTADKQWKFKGDAGYATIFPASSLEAAGLSNNHSFDYLQAGFDDTVANFKAAHVPVFYQNTPYVTTLQGVQTVIIGDCTVVGENTTVIGEAPQRVISEIEHYKKPGNIVIVAMHWGSELDTVPRPWQQALGRKFIDAGADAVVGHHPHVVQGVEFYHGKYIAYSLGNFAFGGNSSARNPDTFILRLRFQTGSGAMSVLPISIVPCWITSSRARNAEGVFRNNYQPKPLFGDDADRTAALVLARSAGLPYGVKSLGYLKLR